LGDVSVKGKIVLKWKLNKWGLKVRTEFIWLRIGSGGKL
jgi:hypothetical protein